MFYISLNVDGNGFKAHPKSGIYTIEKGAMFQSMTIKELIFNTSNLEQDSSYNFLIPKVPKEYKEHPGRQFWPIITASAAKIIANPNRSKK